MQVEINDVHQAAEVILMIMKYEGEIEDVIEYPSEFEDAYRELVAYKVIKLKEGKYVPDENFKKVTKTGFKKYLKDLQDPPRYKKIIRSKPAIGVVAGAILVAAGFLWQSERETR